ncbi:unnamed protein product, partial [Penicillium pancosmium]
LIARSGFRLRLLAVVSCLAFCALVYQFLNIQGTSIISEQTFFVQSTPKESHPIDALIQTADTYFQRLLKEEPPNLASATERYRARRGRHPPPGFAEWFEFAKSKNALVLEEFFDQIYHDLTPFWALDPQELRRQARSISTRIVVRGHVAKMVTDQPRSWMDSWMELVQTLETRLPDIDMPINVMDESRVIVPFETISEYVEKERSIRHIISPKSAVSEYMTLPESDKEETPPFDPGFTGPGEGGYWEMARAGCPPRSPARNSHVNHVNFSSVPWEFDNFDRMAYNGYVMNYTLAKDPCVRPELQALHGTFLEPISVSTTQKLLPIFGGSKLPVNNEILLPPAMYWAKIEHYSGGEDYHGGSWGSKHDKLVWRGSATGGRARESNWSGFQRHRFMSMMNATSVRQAEETDGSGINFKLPDYDKYSLPKGSVPDMIEEHTDTGFVHLVCFPYIEADPRCSYTDPYYEIMPGLSMKDMYNSKYLPDLDGNSFSGRFRGFMLSTSLPIKATIYNEWHDSRLIPWVHFVPMDTTYLDIYGIMAYFLGGHDDVARKIALAGKAWSEKVLRREDMQIYTYRLLLEYARICDDRRESLGFVDDLRAS